MSYSEEFAMKAQSGFGLSRVSLWLAQLRHDVRLYQGTLRTLIRGQ